MTAKTGRGLPAGLFRLLRHDLLHLPALLQLVMALWCRFSLGLDPDNYASTATSTSSIMMILLALLRTFYSRLVIKTMPTS